MQILVFIVSYMSYGYRGVAPHFYLSTVRLFAEVSVLSHRGLSHIVYGRGEPRLLYSPENAHIYKENTSSYLYCLKKSLRHLVILMEDGGNERETAGVRGYTHYLLLVLHKRLKCIRREYHVIVYEEYVVCLVLNCRVHTVGTVLADSVALRSNTSTKLKPSTRNKLKQR